MKNLKTLLSVLLVVCMVAGLCVTGFAAEQDEAVAAPLLDTENNPGIIDMTHLDVKADAKYVAVVGGEEVVLDATLVPETIVVTVKTPGGPINYKFADYHVFETVERGMKEYRIILDVTDGAALNLIQWNGFHMRNVYVSARFVFEDVPEAIADEIEKDENGNYFIDVEDYRYTGIQECTSHNGLRSEGNKGIITGLDLFITASGLVVEVPEETTVPGENTEPEETTVPGENTEPEETTVPGENTEPEETTVPGENTEPEETTVPGENTEPNETTVPGENTEPNETTVPGENTEPNETTKPGETTPPTDNVPDTGDSSNNALLMGLMAVSAFGMVATLVLGRKLKYSGKWE